MLPGNFLKIHVCRAILVHFEQFSGKLYRKFLPLILSASPVLYRYMAFYKPGFTLADKITFFLLD